MIKIKIKINANNVNHLVRPAIYYPLNVHLALMANIYIKINV